MSFQESFPTALLSDKEMAAELQIIDGYYKTMGVETVMVDASEQVELPMLLAILPNDNDEVEEPRVLSHSFQPSDGELVDGTKYFQIYGETPVEHLGIPRLELLELVNLCNTNSQGTMVLLRKNEGQTMVCLRHLSNFPVTEVISKTAFFDMLSVFDVFSAMVELLLEQLSQGKTLEQAQEILGI
ncbi:MAG: hypothetical protein R3Y62_07045 [Eubacteriales bacterium]